MRANGQLSPPLGERAEGVRRQPGRLLDVILDRDFAQNRTIYFSYAEPFDGGGRTALARARLDAGEVAAARRREGHLPPARPGLARKSIRRPHRAGRDGNLFLTNGEHFTDRDMAQTFDNDLGKIVRITPDGAAPPDNPFVNKPGARPEIWSYGHRNPQGLAINPADGKLWEQEHGAMGGDEINIIETGHNYGWPLVSYGVNYDGTPVGTGKATMEGVDDPLWHWTPSIAPSGMAFYTGDLFPAWKGSLFNGALKFQLLSRLELKGDKVVKEERLLQGSERTHPRRAAGPGRRALSAHRQFVRAHPARGAGEVAHLLLRTPSPLSARRESAEPRGATVETGVRHHL